MTDANPADPERGGPEESEPTGPRVTDKRRLDPETGAVRRPASVPGDGVAHAGGEPIGLAEVVEAIDLAEVVGAFGVAEDAEVIEAEAADVVQAAEAVESDDALPDATLAADLTRDLQRLQAEYVNYKKRVDRDRALHRDLAVSSVIEALLPVLDDIHLARQHGDLEGGPFAAIADKLDGTLAKFGVQRFGQPGDAFDPMFHEALMHAEAELAEGTSVTTVVQVLQPGYRLGERLIRAARVTVADPQT